MDAVAYTIPDDLWEQIMPLIPARNANPKKGGRPRADDRQMMTAIFYKFERDIPWKRLPRNLAAASTVHDRFRHWDEQGVFRECWRAGIQQQVSESLQLALWWLAGAPEW